MHFHSFPLKKLAQTLLILLAGSSLLQGQPITGVWKGKMGSSRIELKLIRKGDSLVGTSYYYASKTSYRRYVVKGYFDGQTNDVIWWDEALIEDHGGSHLTNSNHGALLAVADFNCPGEGIMKLDGKSSLKEDNRKEKRELHLVKGSEEPLFPDEWDFLIDHYAYSVMHPELLDSIEQLAYVPQTEPAESPREKTALGENPVQSADPVPVNTGLARPSPTKQELAPPLPVPASAQSNEERFVSRKKILQHIIPVKGDSIELRFYDNAEIDGDSIAVFLNGRLLQEHILLAEQAYIMKISVADLQPDNELVMVAENMGTIPPNTSLMVAIVEDKRYEAHLQSTEGSSALVRLVKP